MKKIILASASAIAIMGLAACSDTDEVTTQGTPPVTTAPAPMEPSATPPANDEMRNDNMGGGGAMAPAPAPTAPAQ